MSSPVAPGGIRYALLALAVAAYGVFRNRLLGVAGALVAGFVLLFHRDPDRTPAETGIVSPADGTVTTIREEDGRVRIGVYMGVWDVHVNRAPADGTVTEMTHSPGNHRPAFSKESNRNEQLRIAFGEFDVVLIAGAFARRIHPYVEPGDAVARGERIGHISFGSRADVVCPPGVELADVTVAEGATVRAGETVLAAAE